MRRCDSHRPVAVGHPANSSRRLAFKFFYFPFAHVRQAEALKWPLPAPCFWLFCFRSLTGLRRKQHIKPTLVARAGKVKPECVARIVATGEANRARIKWLIGAKLRAQRNDNNLAGAAAMAAELTD